jgi:serine protease
MNIDRAHEIRIVARPKPPNNVSAVRGSVADALGETWEVSRVTPRSPLVLIRGHSANAVATEKYARDSHEAAMTLARTGRFEKVEADIPIRRYAEEERAEDVAGAFAPPLRWVHDILRWDQAMAAMRAAGRGGKGIRIGHPDTGYTRHPNLTVVGLDLDSDRDVIDGDDDALDDLEQNPLWPLPFPGHGTSTASVIVGHGPLDQGIEGLAPEARLVPIRATESVVQLFDSDVARAVAHARRVGCHVISMSLGGKGFFGLKGEIQKAVDSGVIVMAAAGNFVGFVTAPASYDNCLAVAATGPNDSLWDGSSRGSAVDVAMPGAQVFNARFTDDKQAFVGEGNGTSFAVAHLAAAATLWLAHHEGALIQRYGARNLQAAFLAVLRWPGVCVVPAHWDFDWGVGRVDLVSLLAAPLPDPGSLGPVAAFGDTANDAASRIAYAINADPVLVRTRLAALLQASDPEEFAELLDLHEGELVYLAYTDPSFAAAVSGPGDVGAFAPEINAAGVSATLGSRLAS